MEVVVVVVGLCQQMKGKNAYDDPPLSVSIYLFLYVNSYISTFLSTLIYQLLYKPLYMYHYINPCGILTYYPRNYCLIHCLKQPLKPFLLHFLNRCRVHESVGWLLHGMATAVARVLPLTMAACQDLTGYYPPS